VAAGIRHVFILKKLLDLVKNQLKPEALKELGVCLSKNKPGQMAGNMAAGGGHVKVLEKVCNCAKKICN